MASGSIWKRCTHDGKTLRTGLPAWGKRQPVPACRCKGGSWHWSADVGVNPDTGRRVQAYGSAPTKTEAQARLQEVQAAARAGLAITDPNLTVESWLRSWLAAGPWKPKTREVYKFDVTVYLIPYLGSLRLQELRRRDVRAMITAMVADGKSGYVIDRARRVLRSALAAAVHDERIPRNVAEGRFPEIPRRRRAVGAILEVDVVRAILERIAADPLWSLEVVLAHTGLRRGELLGLRWADLTFPPAEHPGLVVAQTVVRIPGEHQCPVCGDIHRGRFIQESDDSHPGAKSEAGTDRWVPLSSSPVTALLLHRVEQTAYKEGLGDVYIDHDLVWAGPQGQPLRPDAVSKRHKELAGVDMKTLRRGAVSLLADSGLPLDLIGLVVGHTDPQVTKDHYLRGTRTRLSAAAEDLAHLLAGAEPPAPGHVETSAPGHTVPVTERYLQASQ